MIDPLLEYYETELRHFRQLSAEFRDLHPGVANQLALKDSGSADPHVERLIQAFAFLTARVRSKLDDEFPQLTEALLNVLYPHYLAPIPSMAIVQLVVDAARAQLPKGFFVPRHSKLKTRPIPYAPGAQLPCQYRTGYPVHLWPVQVDSAQLQPPPFRDPLRPPPRTAAVLRLTLTCPGELTFSQLELDKLRFFLHGDRPLVAQLYETLFQNVLQVAILPRDKQSTAQPLILDPRQCLGQVGLGLEEGLLPYPAQSFLGYRLLTEFFTLPDKFRFIDVRGLEKLRGGGMGRSIEIVFYCDKTHPSLEQGVRAETFRLGCTPIVNLFELPPVGISLNHRQHEYQVVPDVNHHRAIEVYAIDSVTSVREGTGEPRTYQPFYSFKHGGPRPSEAAFWYGSRHPARMSGKAGWEPSAWEQGDPAITGVRGSEMFLHLVDLRFQPRQPPAETLLVRTLCTNRDLPLLLQPVADELVFELEGAAPLVSSSGIRSLTVPTKPLRPPLRHGRYWRLLSHLTLNHLSLADGLEGRDALQETLRLYDFSDAGVEDELAAVTKQLIEAITSVSSRRVVGRTGSPTSSGFARGIEVTIEFDESKCGGTGVLLYASVLERFLGLYASINSFSKLVAKKNNKEGAFKSWPPRAGDQPLL